MPHRRAFLLAAVFFTAVAVYGSLVPLAYRPLDWAEAIARFREIRYLSLGVASRADWVANILLFIPLGFLWLAVVGVGHSRRGYENMGPAPSHTRTNAAKPACCEVPVPFLSQPRCMTALVAFGVVATLAALSVGLEFTQLWFPPRTVSLNDILAETLGAIVGAGLWLTLGPAVTQWLHRLTSVQRPKQKLDWLLEAYLLGLIVYSVLPLDLTIRPQELVQKYRAGKISLVPFAHWRFDLPTFYGMFRDVITFVPVGMLAATWRVPAGEAVRPLALSLALGVSIAAALEAAQLLVYSRFTDVGDILLAALGVAAGTLAMQRWYGRDRVGPIDRPSKRVLASATAALLWCGVLLVVFCAPFEPIHDPSLIRQRYEGFWQVPFASLYQGSEFHAISEILKKFFFYAPLGTLFALTVLPLAMPRILRGFLLVALLAVAAGVATTIEMIQVFLPPHVSDITDVLLCTTGAAIGMSLAAWIRGSRRCITRSPNCSSR